MAKSMPTAELEGEKLTPDELRAIDIFKDVKPDALAKFPGTVVRRRFNTGDVICREGEGGTTAFYILEGRARVFIGRRVGSSGRKTKGNILAAIGRLFGQKRATTPTHHADKLVPIDASVDLAYGSLASTLGAGEVFGEMSCLNLAPRSATVVAEAPCVMLEILRNMYEVLQRSPTFKQRMDDNYRQRALANHLRNVPLFAGMSAEDLESLRQSAELVGVEAGHVIFREGDAADDAQTGGLYILRLGQVKVSRHAPGGERTLAYLTRGDCFGETGMLRGGRRNATCSAVDHPITEGGRNRKPARVELVRIAPGDFDRIVQKYPLIKGRLEAFAEQRRREGVQIEKSVRPTSAPPRQVEDMGLLQGQNLMMIDLTRCTRCDQCVDACVSSHDDGVTRLIREGPRFDKYLVPSSCRMCKDPVCMIGCPVGSIRRNKNLSIVIEDWCVGCGVCAKQCPYDSIQMHGLEELGQEVSDEFKRIAEGGKVVAVTERAAVCDQCEELPTGPACVYACPHDAAQRVNASEFLNISLPQAGRL
ncbi:MAG: cyclic nucleotide-binding domain-containing protein [Planctomycetes bacterium]|nr:cyclic nucleotide-binding domain-containing protein [Planctomycetota bacterium]